MFEQIVNLITRGVVALETIAKHYETVGAAVGKQEDKSYIIPYKGAVCAAPLL